MIHPASRLEVVVHSRADGRSAVKSAAYTARAAFRDTRLGKRFSGTGKAGLLSHELINWSRSAEDLWNAAEQAETRSNARVVRELRPSLPAELPLADQVRLVRGFSLWLRDEYGVAAQADLHAPEFHDKALGKSLARDKSEAGHATYHASLFDPLLTNRNFHAHILMTTRNVCRETGIFGAKTRILDDKSSGPEEILRIRQEWEKRTNAALKKIGSDARVDLRSYKTMIAAGDAPEGLVAQDHLGPRRVARSRKQKQEIGEDTTLAGKHRAAVQQRNAELWSSWLQLRALQREQDRELAEQIAAEREVERKKVVEAERRLLQGADSAEEAEAAVAASSQFDSVRMGSAFEHAMFWAREEQSEPPCEEPEFSSTVDLEAYEPPQAKPHPEPLLQPRTVRVRGSRSR
ncbi:MobA/MobL family protein [Sulfitobacter mediterraneus]|uniref:MobA/MobL family protein n=1 Tax=Sulfitobacter mediterraneus TaxID=83219 RepID=UPI00193ADDFD|nr:MobA/MobL family protein [Sulfitobacter mediterraneus]MBM1556214.1 MobA/MobL family protein [Sulfitobacter mediterraneus]MBM1567748.1 MobA/MobL family protein [Sulfitobacter mediterraneus]MBM1571568.1 MobA/MobL family protein [Sulfitobacter mediterraneus]MBM1575356.1 MobA/MobL family protein [Sulfitobacter mediterraneus]MBM1579153.1 MobA/MobL family protein [Sulfitobacter mediterraneus]